MSVAITFLFCLFLARFFYIQVIWQDDLNARALDQWTREIPVSAGRGNIYDANGELLAGSVAAYSVYARASAVSSLSAMAHASARCATTMQWLKVPNARSLSSRIKGAS